MTTLSDFVSLSSFSNTILLTVGFKVRSDAVARLVITGGTGQLGTALLSNETVLQRFEKIVVLSRNLQEYPDIEFRFPKVKFLQCDPENVEELSTFIKQGDLVIHAAGESNLNSAENNPSSVIQNEIRTSISLIEVAKKNKAKKVLFVSSVKACKPTSVYGAGKMILEKLYSSASNGSSEVHFVVVRLASLIGSGQNVLKIWKNLSACGSPILLSHSAMTRYFMRMEDACNLIVIALFEGSTGDVYVPKLSSFRLFDLAHHINDKQEIIITGLKSGEKIHDDLLSIEEVLCCKLYESIYIFNTRQKKGDFSLLNCEELSEVINSFNSAFTSTKNQVIKKFEFDQSVKFLISDSEIKNYLTDSN